MLIQTASQSSNPSTEKKRGSEKCDPIIDDIRPVYRKEELVERDEVEYSREERVYRVLGCSNLDYPFRRNSEANLRVIFFFLLQYSRQLGRDRGR